MPGVTFDQEEKTMQRNLEVVAEKLNVVVVSAVVILVVLVVVSIIRIVGVIEGVSTDVTVEKAQIIRAASDANDMAEIAGVVVNPGGDSVHVQPVVVPQNKFTTAIGHGTRDLIEAQLSGAGPVGINDLST